MARLPLKLFIQSVFTLSLFTGAISGAFAATDVSGPDRRIAHARELMGSLYEHSVVRKAEKIGDINKHVLAWTRESMTGKYAKYADRVAQTVLSESKRYGFDPVFLLAVIENESNFDPTIRGDAGEIGLMQILPTTAKWLKGELKTGWKWKNAEKALLNPVTNIRIGAAYISYLRKQFDAHGRLYLSAYNMGPTNVNRALARQVWPKDYSIKVMEKYLAYYRELRKRHG